MRGNRRGVGGWVGRVVVGVMALAMTSSAATAGNGSGFGREGVLLLVRWDTGEAAFREAAAHVGCGTWQQLGVRPLFRVTCQGMHDGEAVRRWKAAGALGVEVAQVEQDAQETQNGCEAHEPGFDAALWHLENRGQTVDGVEGLLGADVGGRGVWERLEGTATDGCEGVLVAVPDTGIWAAHPTLEGVLWRNPGEVCGDGLDNDTNGFVDDCNGWDFGMDDPDPSPLTLAATKPDGEICHARHATFMAGLIAGVCRGRATLMNLKKHDDASCTSTTADSAEALAYALDHGAKVVVLAFSFQGYSEALDTLLAEAAAAGVIVVMPAGNYAENADTVERYPVHFGHPLGLVVAASDPRDAITAGSSWGGGRVHMTAPGWKLTSTDLPPSLVGQATGTSYAAGLAAGVMANVLAAAPSLTPDQAFEALLQGAERRPWLGCDQSERCVMTGARIDIAGALTFALGGSWEPKPTTDCEPSPPDDLNTPDTANTPDTQPTHSRNGCGCNILHHTNPLSHGWPWALGVLFSARLRWTRRRSSPTTPPNPAPPTR